MALKIEDYALIGDCETAALVGRDGSIDWLCLPRFDSDACFAALLGTPENGRWSLAPTGNPAPTTRAYCADTLVLETHYETADGCVKVSDFMPIRAGAPIVVRCVEGIRGRVPMHLELTLRFGYGKIIPWVRRHPRGIQAIGGPSAILLQSDVELHGRDLQTEADFVIAAGEQRGFCMTWYESYGDMPSEIDAAQLLAETLAWWRSWSERCCYRGKWRTPVLRSLITLKALTYAPSGAIVAAPTTSLPEQVGGSRNWDYRYCWLRDATMTLLALLSAGYSDEATAWREWLLRAAAGSPSDLQIVYGVGGERRLTELTLDWLAGYQQSAPVRLGNAACGQLQWDVYGELMDAMFQCRKHGINPDETAWQLEIALTEFLEKHWSEPDHGIWEIRGPQQNFTHSKVMAWAALDRGIKSIEQFGVEGPLERWRGVRAAIHDDVCRRGFNARKNTFVQAYDSDELDAALLMIPLVGFLPPTDARVLATIDVIERELLSDGFVLRYRTTSQVDGLPPGEGVFLPCSFWLADCYALAGQADKAERLFERLLGLTNDLGLLSEEYDPRAQRQLGNFPQALSHIALVNTALSLAQAHGPAGRRSAR
ncbi:MAG TPA: glycoside hydrolase family 15 protein [Pirellulales bacterium]|nr:glycoside hydrolase family 15 protein [Pirellulales bacterium]